MNIIICGAGKVGFSISKQLSAQGHSVTVIDQSSEDIKKINDTQDVKGIVGRATYPSVLKKAGAEDADMIINITKTEAMHVKEQGRVAPATKDEAKGVCKHVCPHLGCSKVFYNVHGCKVHAGRCRMRDIYLAKKFLMSLENRSRQNASFW